jgi:hypothetical protein
MPAIAKTLEKRGGTLDVGEEEGDRPGRQAGHLRPHNGFRQTTRFGDVLRVSLPFLGRLAHRNSGA